MLKNLTRLLTTATLAAVLALPNIAFGQARAPEDKDDKPKTAKAGKKEGNEKHPVIHHSIQELQAVKKELTTKAASDFGGHKVEAIKSIDEAIHHLQEGLAYDQK
ncbi:MAG TPA: hypothetical protein VJX16_23275 [Terriglobales bacterium]|nr:hypothetical protein [Terriglobales bacterium]